MTENPLKELIHDREINDQVEKDFGMEEEVAPDLKEKINCFLFTTLSPDTTLRQAEIIAVSLHDVISDTWEKS